MFYDVEIFSFSFKEFVKELTRFPPPSQHPDLSPSQVLVFKDPEVFAYNKPTEPGEYIQRKNYFEKHESVMVVSSPNIENRLIDILFDTTDHVYFVMQQHAKPEDWEVDTIALDDEHAHLIYSHGEDSITTIGKVHDVYLFEETENIDLRDYASLFDTTHYSVYYFAAPDVVFVVREPWDDEIQAARQEPYIFQKDKLMRVETDEVELFLDGYLLAWRPAHRFRISAADVLV